MLSKWDDGKRVGWRTDGMASKQARGLIRKAANGARRRWHGVSLTQPHEMMTKRHDAATCGVDPPTPRWPCL